MTTMEFVCRDTGIGMTEEFQKCVFEPFAQGHTGSRTKFAGTTFVTRVPFKIDLDVDKSKEQKDLSEKTIKGLHILLAEDNELNMEIAEFMFQE